MNSDVKGGKIKAQAMFRRDASARTAGAVSASSGGYAIADTSTTAKVGDVYRAETATTGVMVGKEYPVIAASANSFTIASKDLPTLGDTFFILAPVTPRYDSTGASQATIDTTGLATSAKQDTAQTALDAIKTALEILDNTVSGTEMQVDIVAALPAGDNNIGNVDVVSLPALAAGTNNIGDVDVLSLPEIPAGNNNIGDVDIASIAAGDNNIGNVDIVTMPSIPAGTNNIGDVDVLTLPSIPAGTNNIGDVDIASIAAGDNNIGNVDIVTMPSIPAGTNMIGYQTPAAASGSTNATSRVATTALASSLVVKASAGRLYSLVITNTKTSSQYIQIHNTTSAPADTAVPIHSILVPPLSSASLSDDHLGDYYSTGITVCNSSTAATKTIGSADCWFVARYL